jgi:hypothetical protein
MKALVHPPLPAPCSAAWTGDDDQELPLRKENGIDMEKLSDRELATVLAALRTWQQSTWAHSYFKDISTDGSLFRALTNDEIELLCERLNGPARPPADADPTRPDVYRRERGEGATERFDVFGSDPGGAQLVEWYLKITRRIPTDYLARATVEAAIDEVDGIPIINVSYSVSD